MAGVDCILKLGGSALTEKDQLETLKAPSLRRAAALVAQLCKARERRCIVVHGAGLWNSLPLEARTASALLSFQIQAKTFLFRSFGHFQAKKHEVGTGTPKESAASDSLRRGLCLTRLSVTKLNHLVTEQFVSYGIPAVSISPFGTWKTTCKNVSQAGIDAVKDVLEAGYIPVLHGDCALDLERHCCILSGDTIVEILAKTFSPKRVVFLTDVSGIYNCPPDTAGAGLVDSIIVRSDGTMDPAVLTSARPHDTTGGIALKLQTAVNIVSQSHGAVPVLICQLDSEAAERACLTGKLKEGEGTTFSFMEA